MIIGIPRALLYYKYGVLWDVFFKRLGLTVVLSPETDRSVLNAGARLSIDESCLPAKIYLGHIASLIGKCDYILVPRLKSFGKNESVCTKFNALFDIVNSVFSEDLKRGKTRLIDYNVNADRGLTQRRGFLRMAARLGTRRKQALRAYNEAVSAQNASDGINRAFWQRRLEKNFFDENSPIAKTDLERVGLENGSLDDSLTGGLKRTVFRKRPLAESASVNLFGYTSKKSFQNSFDCSFDCSFDSSFEYSSKRAFQNSQKTYESAPDYPQTPPEKGYSPKLLVVGHAYNVCDKMVGEPVVSYLKKLGATVIPAHELAGQSTLLAAEEVSPSLYWTFNKELMGAVALFGGSVDGIVMITAFPCGPDSLVNELILRKFRSLPKLNLIIDEHQSESGLLTRLESFVDILSQKCLVKEITPAKKLIRADNGDLGGLGGKNAALADELAYELSGKTGGETSENLSKKTAKIIEKSGEKSRVISGEKAKIKTKKSGEKSNGKIATIKKKSGEKSGILSDGNSGAADSLTEKLSDKLIDKLSGESGEKAAGL